MALGCLHFSPGVHEGRKVGLFQVEASALTRFLLENLAKPLVIFLPDSAACPAGAL